MTTRNRNRLFPMNTRPRVHLFLLTLAFACFLAPSASAAEQKRPNIVLIFADDLGWKDVGFNGSDFHETPNLNRMAKEGAAFPHAYAAAGNCAPSRACLISGTYTPRHHVYAVGRTDRGPKNAQRLVPVPNRSGLTKDNVTIADALKAAGYATGHFGKWHLAGRDGTLPIDQGFDVSFDSFGDGPVTEGSGDINKKGPPSDPKGVFVLTQKAIDFITANKSRPFFCYLAHHAIHSPLQARPETLARFNAKQPGAQHRNVMYAACTYDLDASVGLLLQKLKEMNLDENTLVVFTSDNGATQASPQEPLRGSKGGYYEGGIRVPFIARWPGMITPGTESRVPIINLDLYPTFLAVAGAAVPAGKTLDGANLLPLLRAQGPLAREAIFWHFPGYLDDPVIRGRESDVRLGFRSRPVSVIRKGDWKLHLFHEEWQLDGGRAQLATNHAVELYDLRGDPGEHRDVSGQNATKRNELLADLLAWLEKADALLPTDRNPEYVPDPAPATGKNRRGKRKGGGDK
jgi:arylsulfatase A-like enzyme